MNPVDRFGVLRRLQRTAGNSSSQLLGERTSGSTSRGLTQDRMSLLARSTWPLDYGCATEDKSRWMPETEQYCSSAPLAKLVPLSVMMLFGMP